MENISIGEVKKIFRKIGLEIGETQELFLEIDDRAMLLRMSERRMTAYLFARCFENAMELPEGEINEDFENGVLQGISDFNKAQELTHQIDEI